MICAGRLSGDQFEIIAGAVPEITAVAQQIVRLKWAVRIQAERREIEIDPARLRVKQSRLHTTMMMFERSSVALL